MPERKQLLGPDRLSIMLDRLCMELIEHHDDLGRCCLIGLQPRGVQVSQRLANRLHELTGTEVRHGILDITFYRDDFRRRSEPLSANQTRISFLVEGLDVVLVDDVLYTGRSVRSALDALNAFGRPRSVELLVLVDRIFSRELPIEPTMTGICVETQPTQKVLVSWEDVENQGPDGVWLLS